MQTAIKFNSSGAGNGFPSCLEKVDVSNFDFWTTLSGVSKSSPTTSDALIQESYISAMSLFWTMEKTSFTATTVEASQTDLAFTENPKERGCNSNMFNQVNITNDAGSQTALYIEMQVKIVRMYKDVTTDEVNFVGYGLKSDPYDSGIRRSTSWFLQGLKSDSSSVRATISSYTDDNTFESSSSLPQGFQTIAQDIAYTTVSGLNVIGWAYARWRTDGITTAPAADATAMTASNDDSSFSLTSIDFYA
jgi:hypothetical protein